MEQVLENHLLKAASAVEAQLDAEINRLENMDDDELDKIRERRVQALKKAQEQKQEWRRNGHGVYSEIPSEKEFFDVCKSSTNVVCHFYKSTTFRCNILDSHLEKLAKDHLECRFIKLNVEKAPFLTERLGIRVIPTMSILKEGKTLGYIVGFTELGNCDDFSTEMLEWRLGHSGIIKYAGDLSNPPDNRKSGSAPKQAAIPGQRKNTKTIRGKDDDFSDSDFDDY